MVSGRLDSNQRPPGPPPRDLAAMGPAGPCLLSCRAAESARVALTLDPKLDHKHVFVLAGKRRRRGGLARPLSCERERAMSSAVVAVDG